MKSLLLSATILMGLAMPASAGMMKCSTENMAKTGAMMSSMPDTPNKMAMNKEMGMANMEMSKGNMKAACSHYMNAQKMGATKESLGGMKKM